MGWSIGYNSRWNRFIGYAVPALCDHPDCNKQINRGLAYICNGDFPICEDGCGLFFCGEHLTWGGLCERCSDNVDMAEASDPNDPEPMYFKPFDPKPELPMWTIHMLIDESWKDWRLENSKEVLKMQEDMGDNMAEYVKKYHKENPEEKE